MNKFIRPKNIIMVILLIIAFLLSFMTRARSFGDIVTFELDKEGEYSITLTKWSDAPEHLHYKINFDEAKSVIDVLDNNMYKLSLSQKSFYYEGEHEHYSYKLNHNIKGKDSQTINVYPDGTLQYKGTIYKMKFEDSNEAKKSQEDMEEIYQWLLNKD
jgi:hypothetical protein